MAPPTAWQLVYVSDALFPVDGVLLDIVRTAEHANALHGLSGVLCYSRSRFVQLVEGERAPLVQLLQNLRRDLRHRVVWTAFRKVPRRCFSTALPMGYACDRQLSMVEAARILTRPTAALTPGALPEIAAAMTDVAGRLYPSHIRLAEPA